MTPADAVAFLERAWPIAVVDAPTSWAAAKLYSDREIRLLKDSLTRSCPRMVPWLRVGAKHAAADNMRLRRKAEDLLIAIDHILRRFEEATAACMSSRTRAFQRALLLTLAAARNSAVKSYRSIREAVDDARDRMLASVPPSLLVSRSPHGDAVVQRVDR